MNTEKNECGDPPKSYDFFRRRVGMLEWHPTAENILVSAAYDHVIIVWDITRGIQVTWHCNKSENRQQSQ